MAKSPAGVHNQKELEKKTTCQIALYQIVESQTLEGGCTTIKIIGKGSQIVQLIVSKSILSNTRAQYRIGTGHLLTCKSKQDRLSCPCSIGRNRSINRPHPTLGQVKMQSKTKTEQIISFLRAHKNRPEPDS